MAFDTMSILAYAFGIVVLYVVCIFFIKPLKFLLRILLNGAFGAVMLFFLNFVGGFFGVKLGLNVFSALTAGLMGIPGVFLMLFIKLML